MVYSKAPSAYYSTLHDSITSACKAILPFGLKKLFLMSAEHRLSKLQSDNLKWQQDSFRQMLNLMGLERDDILPEAEVSAFRTHLLDTLLDSHPDQDHPLILRDKLLFLQDLLYAQCISEGEYHFSRRPLIQKLVAQGAEVEARDVIVAGTKYIKQNSEEEWSVIDLKDEQCLANKENSNFNNKSKQARKQAKGATSVLGFVSPYKPGKTLMEKSIFDSPYLRTNGSGHSNANPFRDGPDKVKRKPFRTLFHREMREGHDGGGHGHEPEIRAGNSAKKQWGFDGFKKWKKSDQDDETVPLPLNERSDSDAHSASYQLFTRSLGEADTKLTKNDLHSDESHSQISIDDKVSEDKIKKELSKMQTELRSRNPNLKSSNDLMVAISTTLSEDKAELKYHLRKYGDVGLDVVKKEFKDHVGQMQNMRFDAEEKHENSMGWTTFEDDENLHPNLIVHHSNSLRGSSINPFSHGSWLCCEQVELN